MRITWHPEAEDELIEAAKFYNQRVAGLGVEFLAAVDRAVRDITGDPERFPLVKSGIQRYRVTRFPYCLYFRCLPDAVRHRMFAELPYRLLSNQTAEESDLPCVQHLVLRTEIDRAHLGVKDGVGRIDRRVQVRIRVLRQLFQNLLIHAVKDATYLGRRWIVVRTWSRRCPFTKLLSKR